MPSRRDAALILASLAGPALLAPRAARAQRAPVEGQDFVRIDKPVDVPRSGKIEVIDFFWYGCPHCYAFEPFLEPWVAKLPADVHFSRIPYGYDEALRETHQRVFYTLDAMGLIPALHGKVFDRFHKQNKPINNQDDMELFGRENGLDYAKLRATWNSFTVQARMRQAKTTCAAYGVDFVPLLAIQGRFLATPRTDTDGPRALVATDNLIDLVRKGG